MKNIVFTFCFGLPIRWIFLFLFWMGLFCARQKYKWSSENIFLFVYCDCPPFLLFSQSTDQTSAERSFEKSLCYPIFCLLSYMTHIRNSIAPTCFPSGKSSISVESECKNWEIHCTGKVCSDYMIELGAIGLFP